MEIASKKAVLASKALAAMAFLAGCGDEALVPTYVGQVEGTDEVVAAVTDGDQVALYLCGGATTFATRSRWFRGTVDERGAFSATSEGFTATGDLTAGKGTITTADGETLTWSMRPAEGPVEGLYQSSADGCRMGAVAADFDGDGLIDLQGTWCDGSQFAQVTPIMPVGVTERGIGVSVTTIPGKGLWVDRVRTP
jgi:hypothetical protein